MQSYIGQDGMVPRRPSEAISDADGAFSPESGDRRSSRGDADVKSDQRRKSGGKEADKGEKKGATNRVNRKR